TTPPPLHYLSPTLRSYDLACPPGPDPARPGTVGPDPPLSKESHVPHPAVPADGRHPHRLPRAAGTRRLPRPDLRRAPGGAVVRTDHRLPSGGVVRPGPRRRGHGRSLRAAGHGDGRRGARRGGAPPPAADLGVR